MNNFHKQLKGTIQWLRLPKVMSLPEEESQVWKSYTSLTFVDFKSENEIHLGFEYQSKHYLIELQRRYRVRWEGSFTVSCGGKVCKGEADCKLYTNEVGALLLGRWKEKDDDRTIHDYTWWAELQDPAET